MPVLVETEYTESRIDRTELRPLLAMVSIAALFCASLEVTALMYVDALSLYMTPLEIALDLGVALVILACVSIAWWSSILALEKTLTILSWDQRRRRWLCWCLWLAVPFSYFALEVFAAIRLQLFPNWHPGALASLLSALGLMATFVIALSILGLSTVQSVCSTRLAPIGSLHLALGFVILAVLLARGVHPYHDFARIGRPSARVNQPDIYLITIDALRAEDMSVYGYDRPTTPNLQRFAQHAFVFENFVANSNFTDSATTSIETGKLPWSHRVFQLGGFVPNSQRQETLAAQLHERGYYTSMISSNLLASPFSHGTTESYDAVAHVAPVGLQGFWMRSTNLAGINGQATLFYALLRRLAGSLSGFVDKAIWHHRYPHPAEPVFAQARTLVESHESLQPLFVWTHILPPHDPYWPPSPYLGRFSPKEKLTQIRGNQLPRGASASDLRAQYDEMIMYADHAVGDYLDWLDRTGRLDRAVVVVTADHGESFEHNWFQHAGPYLYNGLIRIPLLIHLPGQKEGLSIPQLSQQTDLLPTLLDLVGVPIPAWADGTSLKPALAGKRFPSRYVYSMTLATDHTSGPISNGTLAVMDDTFKYLIRLDSQKEELYRYKTDRLEEHNLAASEAETAKSMHDLLLNKLKEVNARPASTVVAGSLP